jgi:hypothetical protein
MKLLVEKNDDLNQNDRLLFVIEKGDTRSLLQDLDTLLELIDKFNC